MVSLQHARSASLPRPFVPTSMTIRLRSHDYSARSPRPFAPAPTTIRPSPHIKRQTATYLDKTTNTSGQKRWTTKVIHLIRPFASHHSTIHIVLRDRSQRVTRPLTSPFATARNGSLDRSRTLARHPIPRVISGLSPQSRKRGKKQLYTFSP